MFQITGAVFLGTLLLVPVYMLVATTTWPRSKDAPQWAVDVLAFLLLATALSGFATLMASLWDLFT